MYPIVTIFGKDFSMYALMAIVGMLIGGFVFCKQIKRRGYDDNDAIIFLLVLCLGILSGGTILYAITNWRLFPLLVTADSLNSFWETFQSIFGGSVFYGGLIGAIIVGLAWIKRKNLPREVYLDSCAILAPLFHAFARIGCFFGGCCYGIESSFGFSAHGNTFTDIGEVRRFPVQLLESLLNLLVAVLIYRLAEKNKLKGALFYLYLALYGVIRFFDEFLRGDEIRGFILGLSTSQFISIFIEITAVTLLLIHIRKSKKAVNDEEPVT